MPSRKKAESSVNEVEPKPVQRKSKGKPSTKHVADESDNSNSTPSSSSKSPANRPASAYQSSSSTSSSSSASSSTAKGDGRGVTEFASKVLTGSHVSWENIPKCRESWVQRTLLRYQAESTLYMLNSWEKYLFHGIVSVAIGCASYFAYVHFAAWTN